MLNQFVLVGKILDFKENIITIESSREDNKKDIIPITLLSNNLIENVSDYCGKGDVVGIKGKIGSSEDGSIYIYADKVTFLTTKKEDEGDD